MAPLEPLVEQAFTSRQDALVAKGCPIGVSGVRRFLGAEQEIFLWLCFCLFACFYFFLRCCLAGFGVFFCVFIAIVRSLFMVFFPPVSG